MWSLRTNHQTMGTCKLQTSSRQMLLLLFLCLQLYSVAAQSGTTDSASTTQKLPHFPKCISSCVDETGRFLPDGDYAYCLKCDVFVQCVFGNLYKTLCPPGTNYYDPVEKVCVKNSSLCVDGIYLTSTLPTIVLPTDPMTTTGIATSSLNKTTVPATTFGSANANTTSTTETTTTTSEMSTTAAQTTSTASITTTTTSATTTGSTTTTVITLPAATTTSTETTTPQPTSTTAQTTTPGSVTPATTTPQTSATTLQTLLTTIREAPTDSSTTNQTTSPTKSLSTTTVSSASNKPGDSNNTGFIPSPGAEAECFWFAIDLYNQNSGDKTRTGVLRVKAVTSEILDSSSGGRDFDKWPRWYRLFGVVLVRSQCPNTAENMSANYIQCPFVDTSSSSPNEAIVATCDFKVLYSPQSPSRVSMVYMMCYK